MITPSERAFIAEHAYIPEHLPHYVTAISQTEPFLLDDFIAHVRGDYMVFVGYPLREEFEPARLLAIFERAKTRFKPTLVSLLAPALPDALKEDAPTPSDEYYRLDLTTLAIPQKTRNMLTRAQRDVVVDEGTLGKAHKQLLEEFLRAHRLDDATRTIFKRVPEYAKSATVVVLQARDAAGNLVAFDIADFGSQQYAFYMFNFRSRRYTVPGAADLLFARLIERAQAEGKRYVNLGLGVDEGIAFFKRKWGAVPFLKHYTRVQRFPRAEPWSRLFEQWRV